MYAFAISGDACRDERRGSAAGTRSATGSRCSRGSGGRRSASRAARRRRSGASRRRRTSRRSSRSVGSRGLLALDLEQRAGEQLDAGHVDEVLDDRLLLVARQRRRRQLTSRGRRSTTDRGRTCRACARGPWSELTACLRARWKVAGSPRLRHTAAVIRSVALTALVLAGAACSRPRGAGRDARGDQAARRDHVGRRPPGRRAVRLRGPGEPDAADRLRGRHHGRARAPARRQGAVRPVRLVEPGAVARARRLRHRR